jgi:CheY-like chemotaxis protein
MPLIERRSARFNEPAENDNFQYCWQFNSPRGQISKTCQECIVYKSGTKRCYEMSGLSVENGFEGQFCKNTCHECEYYHMVNGKRLAVLVVTDETGVRRALGRMRGQLDFALEITDCEYRCSMMIERFRPDYVVIDCSMGTQRCLDFARMLREDPRIPMVRVVLIGASHQLPKHCEQLVYATMGRRLTASALQTLISGPAA